MKTFLRKINELLSLLRDILANLGGRYAGIDETRVYSFEEAMEVLGVGKDALRGLLRSGKVKFRRIGKGTTSAIRILGGNIIAYMKGSDL